jgi:sodium/potassium-transporting ATPase subunit alpha
MEGSAFGIVIAIGDNTLIGFIARMTAAPKEAPSTLKIEIQHFVRFLAVLSMIMGSVFFVVGIT